ncbi:hypothetical protein MASR1M12_44410 [Erysipelotrichia bacterium]
MRKKVPLDKTFVCIDAAGNHRVVSASKAVGNFGVTMNGRQMIKLYTNMNHGLELENA